MTIQQLPSGEMQMTAEGQSYKFKIDGKEYPAFWGMTAIWKQVDPSTWETIYKQGAMTTTSVTKISTDGKTLTTKSTGKKPNAEDFQASATSERVSGGPGLAGKWKSTKVQVSTENWEISANGDDGLTMKIVDYNCRLQREIRRQGLSLHGSDDAQEFHDERQEDRPAHRGIHREDGRQSGIQRRVYCVVRRQDPGG